MKKKERLKAKGLGGGDYRIGSQKKMNVRFDMNDPPDIVRGGGGA